MENYAISLLKKRKAELDSIEVHNDKIKNELPKKVEVWRTEGIDENLIVGRSIRFYGDYIFYNEQELKDINDILKYLNIDF